jgi:cell division protein FtsQ
LRWGLVTLLCVALLCGGWLWLRGSSLVAVRDVKVIGVRGPQAAQIEAALRSSAKGMTTMKLDEAALRASVASFPVVEGLSVSTSFPHGLRIVVQERPPVATLVAGGQRTALAADGTVLGAALASTSLPSVSGSLAPAPGQRVSDGRLLAAIAILGAAPSRLARFATRVYEGPEGLTVAMRNGLVVYFGDASRPHAKWLSLASVLADPSSAGATYVDVRVPNRPAAGHGSLAATGSASGSPAASTTGLGPGAVAASGASDPAVLTLAERLAGNVGGEAATTQSATEQNASTGGERERPEAETASSAGQGAVQAPAQTSAGTGASQTAVGGASGSEEGAAPAPSEPVAGGAAAP